MEQFKEWDYREKDYNKKSTVEINIPNRINYSELQRFEKDFGIIPKVLEYSLQKYKPQRKLFERRTKKMGRLNPDYAIDELIRAHNGQEFTQKIYDTHNNTTIQEREITSTFGVLLDMSGSTRFEVDKSYRRIDLIKFSSLALGRILSTIDEPFFIYGFHTSSRADPTIMEEYKNLSGIWDVNTESRIAAIDHTAETSFYNNKDGAAIRFANKIMKSDTHRNRNIILVTDGFPNCDDTYYRGATAYYDTAKAMEEGIQEGIKYIYLTINPDNTEEFMGIINPFTAYSKQFKSMRDVVEGLPLAYEKIKVFTEQ